MREVKASVCLRYVSVRKPFFVATKSKWGVIYMPKTEFDYYYGVEAEQFTFVRVPKVLFTDK